jgi:hypothetical protein
METKQEAKVEIVDLRHAGFCVIQFNGIQCDMQIGAHVDSGRVQVFVQDDIASSIATQLESVVAKLREVQRGV